MSTITTFYNLTDIATHFRKDLTGDHRPLKDLVLFFAHNSTGKTRLSMEFKEAGKVYDDEDNVKSRDTLYFNAYTEDLFSWHNDLVNDADRYLKLNTDSAFFDGLRELELDAKIESFFHNYVDLKFNIDYEKAMVRFSRSIIVEEAEQTIENIKISRGEERIFVWCFFLALFERHRRHQSGQTVEMVAVQMSDEDPGELVHRQTGPGNLHLRPFAAIDQKTIFIVFDDLGGESAFRGGGRGGCAKKKYFEQNGILE